MNRQGERRKDYESPRTRMVQVETEGNLCGSVTGDDKKGVKIESTPQEYQEFDVSTETDKNAITWE